MSPGSDPGHHYSSHVPGSDPGCDRPIHVLGLSPLSRGRVAHEPSRLAVGAVSYSEVRRSREERLRERARAVVIGGGVGGCSILYWLARLGWGDVVLVERADLTSGSTFHSAGLVGQLRSSLPLTRMAMSSVEVYRALGDEVGREEGWHEVGSLRLAGPGERVEELRGPAG